MSVQMEVAGLAVDAVSKAPIVVLKELDGERAFPIWIGASEASAISTRLEGIELPRPLTHDLLAQSIAQFGAEVVEVEVTALEGSTFFAVIRLLRGEERMELDSRPSDAIALALRTGADIYVAEAVIDRARKVTLRSIPRSQRPEAVAGEPSGSSAEEAAPKKPAPTGPRLLDPNTPPERWTDVLKGLDPEDFGQYEM